MGGDRRSHRMGAWAEVILGWIEEAPDITLTEVQARLRAKEAPSAMGTLWRLLDRDAMTVKNRAGHRTEAAKGGAVPGAVEAVSGWG